MKQIFWVACVCGLVLIATPQLVLASAAEDKANADAGRDIDGNAGGSSGYGGNSPGGQGDGGGIGGNFSGGNDGAVTPTPTRRSGGILGGYTGLWDMLNGGGPGKNRNGVPSGSGGGWLSNTMDSLGLGGVGGFISDTYNSLKGMVVGAFSGGTRERMNEPSERHTTLPDTSSNPAAGYDGSLQENFAEGDQSAGTVRISDLSVADPAATSSAGTLIVNGVIHHAVASSSPFTNRLPALRGVMNVVELDYACIGTVDRVHTFSATAAALEERLTPFEERINNVPSGELCLTVTVDSEDVVPETDEDNNQSIEVRLTFDSTGASDTSSVTGTPADTQLPEIVLEYRILNASGSPLTTWDEGPAVLAADEEIALRWNAPEYDDCLAFINYADSPFGNEATITANTGNTEVTQTDLREVTGIYAIECTSAVGSSRQEIVVTVAEGAVSSD